MLLYSTSTISRTHQEEGTYAFVQYINYQLNSPQQVDTYAFVQYINYQ